MADLTEATNASRNRAEIAKREPLGAASSGKGVERADSEQTAALFTLGQAAHRGGKHERAIEHFDQAIAVAPANAEYYWHRACARFALERLEEAASDYREASRLKPDSAAYRNDLGVVLARRGRRAEAAEQYREAIRLQPEFPDAHNNLGNALRLQGKVNEAIACYREALRLRKTYPEARNNLGIALRSQGKLDEAIASYEEALRLRPAYPEAHTNLGIALAARGRADAAVACHQQAIRLRPDYAEAYFNLGGALADQNRHDQAAAAYREVIRLRPNDARAHKNMGIALARHNQVDEAMGCYREALRIRPNYPEAHNDLGIALARKNRYEEAEASYRNALKHRPDYTEAHNNLGNTLRNLGRFDEAVACFDRAVALKPNYADAYNNRGIAFAEQAHFDKAIDSYSRCIKLRPNHVDAHLNRALTWLRQGNFALGWAEYESRLRKRNLSARLPSQPAWNGYPPAGLRVLLVAEQGLGDSLQFIRYAPLLKQRGATVYFECPEKLVKLLGRTPGIDQLVSQGQEPPEHDVYAPLLTLPGLLGTSLESVPTDVPYIHPDPDLVEHWRRELAGYPEFKVGVNWQGNPGYAGDFHRSMPLRHFEALARVPGVRLFSLQKNAGSEQLEKLGNAFSVVNLGSRLDVENGPFMDTAAVMKNLDLFITSDTAVTHLAGAMGVPVWVALSAAPGWQWMMGREDSPWYPSVRLFRQATLGDWPSVFERMAAELRTLVPPTAKVAHVIIPVAPGELIDKITILQIKAERISEPDKLAHVRLELETLMDAYNRSMIPSAELSKLMSELFSVNEELWRIEDEVRECDRTGEFGPSFVVLSQSVYRTNDRRAALKRQINALLNAEMVEEKSYGSDAHRAAESVRSNART